MKTKASCQKNFFLLILFILSIPVNFSAQDFKTVHEGVEHAGVNYKLGDDPVKINLLRLDLKKVRLDVNHAMDAAIGTEKTSSIATRHGAIAAINAGFFRLDTSIFAGDTAGILQIDGKLLSEVVNPRTAIVISNDFAPVEITTFNLNIARGQSYFASLDATQISLERLESDNQIVLSKKAYKLMGINRERKADELIAFTPEFGRTTLTNGDGIEVVVRGGKIVEILRGSGSAQIPVDGFVISATGKESDLLLKEIRLKQKVSLEMRTLRNIQSFDGASSWKSAVQAEDIVAGVPQLIKNGKIDITWEQEKSSKSFVETRHPRTAVAKMKDGKFLMITVDGRQPGVSVGMNLNELAEYLLGLGAVDAMNLDGGGSTTMFLDGKVVNTPSDKEGERKVGDAILVTLRKKIAPRKK